MNIYIYSDESGVFDKYHNKYFVYAGIIFLSKEEKDICSRKYVTAENTIRKITNTPKESELKASKLLNSHKGKLFRALNHQHKFCGVIRQQKVMPSIYANKKSKQRFLDYAFKRSVKKKFEELIADEKIIPENVENLFFYVDEHTTATDGQYELRESLEQEFKYGVFNHNFSHFFPPLFPNLQSVELKFCNSGTVTLIRAADIIANKVFYHSKKGTLPHIQTTDLTIVNLP